MPCVLLALVGPMQSWGTMSRFAVRDTGRAPSKSGVVGLCAAALGRRRDEPIEDLALLQMGVRVDAEGRVQRDFHTAQEITQANGKLRPYPIVSKRYFLADAAFLVALEGDREVVKSIDEALRCPRWPLFLGRRAFPPSGPVGRGIVDKPLDDALATAAWVDPSKRRKERLRRQLKEGENIRLRTVVDTSLDEATEIRRDQPVSFQERAFIDRPTKTGYVPLTPEILGFEKEEQ